MVSRAKELAARWPWAPSIFLGIAAILLRAALLPLVPHPVPQDHDEVSYAFQAEVFAHGHFAFPVHPLWRFFQVVHVISRPVWMSKYLGGQSLFLAVGALLGDLHWGVVLSFALYIVAVHWLIRKIAPPQWALVGALAVLVVFNVRHYWLESFWGGFVAASGGCFILGALLSRPTAVARSRWFLPLGALLLCTTRPFEGLALVILGSFLVNGKMFRARRAMWAAPFAASALVSAGVILAYGWLTLGSPLRLPYLEHERQYAVAPSLWLLPLRSTTYDDPVIESFHERWEVGCYLRLRDMPIGRRIPFLFLRYAQVSAFNVFGFSSLPLLLVPLYLRNTRIRRLALLWVLMGVPLALEIWMFPHYTAPVSGALIALGICVARAVRIATRRNPSLHRIAIGGLLVVVFAPALWQDFSVVARQARRQSPPRRQRVIESLSGGTERNVIFVRYTELDWHAAYDDWVRNRPSIDDQAIIWARDRGPDNENLIRYYRGRRFWLLNPDEKPLRLQPYFGGAPLRIQSVPD